MTPAAKRTLRSTFPADVRRWCGTFARRWYVPVDELTDAIVGGDIIPAPSEVWTRAAQVSQIVEALDVLIPHELQWNFWYRPSVCQPLAPMCRLGWSENCLEELIGELQTLRQFHARADSVDARSLTVMKLFKPAVTFKCLERGCAVTHLACEVKPLSYQPLEFLPGEHAPLLSGPPPQVTSRVSTNS
jgi:hypothetical protein